MQLATGVCKKRSSVEEGKGRGICLVCMRSEENNYYLRGKKGREKRKLQIFHVLVRDPATSDTKETIKKTIKNPLKTIKKPLKNH